MSALLIDGDVLVYRSALAAETAINWSQFEDEEDGEEVWTIHATEQDGEQILLSSVESLKKATGIEKVHFALSDTDNFRKRVLDSYKRSRSSTRKPLLYGHLRQFIRDNYSTWERPSLEADDVLGILATHPKLIKGKKVIASIDKDFNSIPCTFYNFNREETTEISEEQADYYHMYQTLIGDPVDGYTGCPGIGPKGAEKVLSSVEPEGWWEAIVKAYEKKGFNEEYALQQARVARILRWTDYDYVKKEPILWQPK